MKYKKINPNEKSEAGSDLHTKRVRRAMMTGIVFIVLFGIFEALVALEWKPVYPIYLASLTVLLILFLFFNKGFSTVIPPREALPDRWSEEDKDAFYEKFTRDKDIARRLLIFVIPLLFVFLLDFIILFLPDLLGL